jgi:REP element-mobilizing transposase RayT
MASKPRLFAPNTIHHIYNRGSQKMTLFSHPKDYSRFLLKIQEYKERYPVEILAYCLMPNHFHFLIREPDDDPKGPSRPLGSNIADFLHILQTAYAKYFQAIHPDFSGRVFQGTYKSKLVEKDPYFLQLFAYIHDNPVRKGLVQKPESWPYSSYLGLIGVRRDDMITYDPDIMEISHQQIYEQFASSRKNHLEQLSSFLFHNTKHHA